MKTTLITVGKIKEKYLKDAIAEYSKRLSRTANWRLWKWQMKRHQITQVTP